MRIQILLKKIFFSLIEFSVIQIASQFHVHFETYRGHEFEYETMKIMKGRWETQQILIQAPGQTDEAVVNLPASMNHDKKKKEKKTDATNVTIHLTFDLVSV